VANATLGAVQQSRPIPRRVYQMDAARGTRHHDGFSKRLYAPSRALRMSLRMTAPIITPLGGAARAGAENYIIAQTPAMGL